MSCDCPSGNYGCECCCASVTGLRAGIHPDYIRSVYRDIAIDVDPDSTSHTPVKTNETKVLSVGPIHIVSVTVSLAAVVLDVNATSAADLRKIIKPAAALPGDTGTPVMFSLFQVSGWSAQNLLEGGWMAHNDNKDSRVHIVTGALTSSSPSWQSPPDLFGYFVDGGLFAEMNAPTDHFGIRVCVNYIDRKAFSPAYGTPIEVLKHYWSCSHGDREFLDGFYGGNSFNIDSGSSAYPSPAYSYTEATIITASSTETGDIPFSVYDLSESATGLKLNLDANEGVTYDSSNRVETWSDLSDADNDAIQAVDANKPTWISNRINGLPAISFDGTNDFMKLPDGSLLTNGGPYTMIAVVKAGRAGTYDPILAMGASGDKVSFNIHTGKQSHYNGTWTAADGFTSPATAISSTGIGTSAYHLIASVCGEDGLGGFSQVFYLDGSADGTTAISASSAIPGTWDQVDRWIGGDEGSQWFQGHIARLLVWNVALSSGSLTLVSNALLDQYDLA